ncbi:MAG: ABC transporter permease [Dehalococcoidia bacterium]|nr:ABC transporter permease [Dehalococcoidia bacterium]
MSVLAGREAAGGAPEPGDLLEGTEWVAAPPSARSRARPAFGAALRIAAPPLLAAALALTLWEAWVRAFEVREYLVPAPSAVLRALAADPARYLGAARVTLAHALGGLAVGAGSAFLLAVVMAHSRPLERALYPLAILVKVTPVVAVAPLFLIWFGFNAWPKVLVAALITFFPMLVNAVTGLRSVEPAAFDFLRALDASRWQLFWKLRLPSSLPYVLAALRISVPLAVIGAVVAEWFAADTGVGQIIVIANGELDTPTLFAAVLVLALIGVTLTLAIAYIEHRVLFWHESSTGV